MRALCLAYDDLHIRESWAFFPFYSTLITPLNWLLVCEAHCIYDTEAVVRNSSSSRLDWYSADILD